MNKFFVFFASLCVLSCTPKNIEGGVIAPPKPPGPEEPIGQQVLTYSYPDVIVADAGQGFLRKSNRYEITVCGEDGVDKPVYVMEDRNSYNQKEGKGVGMGKFNHIAQFSFDGQVKVKIKRKDGKSLNNVVLYPKKKGYTYTVESDHISITLDQWAYIYVEFPDLNMHVAGKCIKEPLFLFADPLLENVPKKDKWAEVITPEMTAAEVKEKILSTPKKTIYFSEGVYDFNEASVLGNNYSGYQLPLVSNKDYYIPGGAVIVGSFNSISGQKTDNVRFFGHGIVTAAGKDRLGDAVSIPYNLYNAGGGTGCVLEGIHFVAPSHFSVLSRGDLYTKFTKMFGWWHQTDGWGGDEYAVLENSFVKANDDNIKVYRDFQKIKNNIVYKQINGAAIQLGWGEFGATKNSVVEDLYIIKDDIKTPSWPSNTAVINLVTNGNEDTQSGSTISDNLFKNIYIESDVQRLFGLNCVGGSINNITVENMILDGENMSGENYIVSQFDGKYNNIKFKNLVINGTKITSDKGNPNWNMLQKVWVSNKNYSDSNLTTIIYE